MLCDLCGVTPAVFLVGNIETGDQTAMCGADFARSGLEAAKAILPQGEILDALGIHSASEAETEAAVKAAAKAPKRAKGKRSQLDAIIESGRQVDDGDEPALRSESESGPETTPTLEGSTAAASDG